MKSTLSLRQSQHLSLTPQLQQSIRLLQLSTLEINQEVERLLNTNPLLERAEEGSNLQPSDKSIYTPADLSRTEDEIQQTENEQWIQENREEPSFTFTGEPAYDSEGCVEIAADTPTLREHLISQLCMSQHNTRDQKIIGLLIDALDENGYLEQPLEEIHAMLPAQLNITLDDLETALVQLQHLDQPGIAARNLSECLTLQLKALPKNTPCLDLAIRIVSQHLSQLGAHEFTKLKKILRCDDDTLRTAQSLITHLQPKPGTEFNSRTSDYVIPDVIVEHRQGNWHARINQNAMPRLRINQLYAGILQRSSEKNLQQLTSELQEARWFIKNLQQRFDTILRVSQKIVDHQHKFFEYGESAMRPLVLREIAEQLDLHESTVSRVTTQKFMFTPRGVYELKYFFCNRVSTPNGDACSSTAVRALIKDLVSKEDAQCPLTDTRIAELLTQQGTPVARRTVAKYREFLNIPPSNLRKSV